MALVPHLTLQSAHSEEHFLFVPARDSPMLTTLILTAVLFFSYTSHNITGIDEARQLKQNTQALEITQRRESLTSLGEQYFKDKRLGFYLGFTES